MEISAFRTQLNNGTLRGAYILAGEEDYLKRHYLSEIRRTVLSDGSMAVFNHITLEGSEIDYGALRDAVIAPPVMSDTKLVEWKYPSFQKMTESDCLALEEICALVRETPGTVLAFLVADGAIDLGTPKRPSKFVKRFDPYISILNFELSTEAQLVSWLKKHFSAEGVSVSDDALRLLISRSGRSMTVLNNEVIKLSAYALSRGVSVLGSDEVAEVASFFAEGEEFALSNAILSGNAPLAYSALMDMKRARVEPVAIIGMLARIYSELVAVSELLAEGQGADDIASRLKMNPYKLKLYINAVKRQRQKVLVAHLAEICRVDAASKFGGVGGYVAVELLVGRLLQQG